MSDKNPELEAAVLSGELEMVRRAKRQIRARMKALRNSYPQRALAERSERIRGQLEALECFANARGVALFWPLVERGEVDLRPLLERCLTRQAKVFFPFQEPKPDGRTLTGFRRVREVSELERRGQAYYEPSVDADTARPGDVDVVVVPALAADLRGHRVGYGAGYYDATLGDVAPPAQIIIVVYDFQLLAELPIEAHDRAADYLVTETRALAATSAQALLPRD